MTEIGAFEAKTQFSKLLDRAEQGEEFVVTRRGEPIVRLGPFKVKPGSREAHSAMDELRRRASQIGINVTPEELKAWINAGRH